MIRLDQFGEEWERNSEMKIGSFLKWLRTEELVVFLEIKDDRRSGEDPDCIGSFRSGEADQAFKDHFKQIK